MVSAALLFTAAAPSWGQQTTAPSPSGTSASEDEEVFELSPFEVTAGEEETYTAATTLAGNRLNTELRDIGNSVTVITSQFLKDIAATSNETLLQYTAGTEVGNIRGNFAGLGDGAALSETNAFANPNQNTRVRGLAQADNTRDYFLSDIPWDSYNVDRVDLQRGPNSILFGLGSPAGLLNVGTKQAGFKDSNEISYRTDSWGSHRLQGSFNKVILPKELAVRIDTLYDKEKFQQEQAYEDDNRITGSFRYEPGFLKKGSARTIIKGSIENGNIKSNRPRSVPPLDRITPWFDSGTYNGTYNRTGAYRDANGNVVNATAGSVRVFNSLNRETFNPYQVQDDNTGRVNHGQQRPSINGGPDTGFINAYFNPWVGNFADQFGGINGFYSSGAAEVAGSNFVWENRSVRGLNSSGAIDGSIAFQFHRPVGIARYDQWAANSYQPYYASGLFKGKNLTDPSVFDFYNNLIDGPNKWEWNDWNSYNVSLAQTFMNDKFGFEANLYSEDFTRGQISLLSGDRQAIYVDINNVYSDGTPAGANGEPFQDGTPNPNVGRPFISDSGGGGNTEYISERDSARFTAFFTHDFTRGDSNNLLTRILGKHTLTGLYSDDKQVTDNRNWRRYAALDDNYRSVFGMPSGTLFSDNFYAYNRVIYLGDSLAGRSSASGAYIPAPTAQQSVNSAQVRLFDSTWVATGVNPGDPWENEYYPVGHPSRTSTQSENPLNYRGFVTIPVNIIDSEASKAYRDLLTTGAQLTKQEVESKAFVWQGYLWDKAIVGTFGYREDTAKAWGKALSVAAPTATNGNLPNGHLNLSRDFYKLPDLPSNTVEGTSRSYSIVAHANQLPFISKFAENLPVQVSFFYNKSTNFQPAATRVDVYGEPLAPPNGKTIDRGILLETKDGKYSLRINKYVTYIQNAQSSAISNPWFIGSSQAWGTRWANIFEYNWSGNNSTTAVVPNQPGNTRYNYGTDVGETQADAQAREAAAVAAWRAWENSVDPRFWTAWSINRTNLAVDNSAAQPQGFTITEDSRSEGYEIEFNANPTRNWRLTFNATQTKATRYNIGGENLKNFIAAYEKALTTTKAGDLRIWWGGAGNVTTTYLWFQEPTNQVGADWAQKKLAEGSTVPELRKWRFNAITNYNFTEGFFRGFNVGGGVRWQDKIAIGYPLLGDPYSTSLTTDLANPYYGPKEINFDAWVGYNKRLSQKFFGRNIDWNIQLNVSNIGQGNELIPVTVQPDGSPGTYRIAPHQYWTLTNTLRF